MGDFSLNEYVVQIHEVNTQQLINMFDSAITNYTDIQDKLKSSMSLVEESRNRMINDIKSLYK